MNDEATNPKLRSPKLDANAGIRAVQESCLDGLILVVEKSLGQHTKIVVTGNDQ